MTSEEERAYVIRTVDSARSWWSILPLSAKAYIIVRLSRWITREVSL